MLELWQGLSEAQSSLLQTALIIVAGGLGVLLSAALFGRRVRNLETALQETEKKMGEALQRSQAVIGEINELVASRLGTMDEQLAQTLEVLGQLRAGVSDLQDSSEENANELRQELKVHWQGVRAELELLAANPQIHGKTRTRYARVSRRNMLELVEALCRDDHMDPRRETDFREAIKLWNWHRNGKATLTQADVSRMKDLAGRILARQTYGQFAA